jgi:hypothetical protein
MEVYNAKVHYLNKRIRQTYSIGVPVHCTIHEWCPTTDVAPADVSLTVE